MSSLFSKIIAGEIPCKKVYENEHVLAFWDIHPQAPVHILIVPKKEYKDLQSIPPQDLYLIQEVVKAAQKIADDLQISHGYRLLTNCGPSAGQSVFHIHFHLVGGRDLEHHV